jgi:hypothetical protein
MENEEICPNEKCGTNLKDLKRKQYFIEIPIESQLLNILKRNNTLSLLKERFKRKKKNETGIEDIYDGTVYKKLSLSGGPLSEMSVSGTLSCESRFSLHLNSNSFDSSLSLNPMRFSHFSSDINLLSTFIN